MRRRIVVLSVVCSLVFAASAWATTTYGPTKTWYTGDSAQSNYNTSYWDNIFATYGAYATTVTFIDATGYNWHDTSAITSSFNETFWTGSGESRSMYCKYRDQFSTTGSCYGQ